MSDFVTDLTSLPTGKIDSEPSTDPENQTLTSENWEATCQAVYDLRAALLALPVVTAKAVLIFGVTTSGTSGSALQYVPPGGGAALIPNGGQLVMGFAGTVKSLGVRSRTGPAGGSQTYRVHINGAASGLTVTMAIAGTNGGLVELDVPFSKGDLVAIELVGNGGITLGAADVSIALAVEFA